MVLLAATGQAVTGGPQPSLLKATYLSSPEKYIFRHICPNQETLGALKRYRLSVGLVVRINDRRHSLRTLPHVKYGAAFNRHCQIRSSQPPEGWRVCINPVLRWRRWRQGRKQYGGKLEKSGSQGQHWDSGSWALTQPNNEGTLKVWVK